MLVTVRRILAGAQIPLSRDFRHSSVERLGSDSYRLLKPSLRSQETTSRLEPTDFQVITICPAQDHDRPMTPGEVIGASASRGVARSGVI